MMRIILPLFLGVCLLSLQATLFTSLSIQRIRPDLVLILTLYLAFSYPVVSGGFLAFIMGFLMDLFSGNPFGLYTFSRPFIFFVAWLFKERLYLEGFLSQSLFVFFLALGEGFLILILLNTFNPIGHFFPMVLTTLLPQSFFTALIAPVLSSIFNTRLFSLFTQESEIRGRGGR